MKTYPRFRSTAAALLSLLIASQSFALNVVQIPALVAPVAGLSAAVAAPTILPSAPSLTPAAVTLAATGLPTLPVTPSLVPRTRPTAPSPAQSAASNLAQEQPSARTQLNSVAKDWEKTDADGTVEPQSAAAPTNTTGRVAADVLDLDGNALGRGFPTKIILFQKGGAKEFPVSTADFAVIESKVGTDYIQNGVNLKDYEISKERGSFRNFKGKQLVADLKYAVENLPKSAWQGPSWPAMVHALNDPETARFVYVLTAREHSPEEMMEAFKYLQSKGEIKYLPLIENLHAVGSAPNVPGRKTEVMAQIIDSIAAIPFGADASKVLNANGTAKTVLHTIGFSDDTWANFEKMRDALTKTFQAEPKRWKNVKIILFYTGTDPAHAPGAVVLKLDGATRPLTTDEHGEEFVRHLEPDEHVTPHTKHLPRPTEGRSPIATVGDAIKRMFVSHAYGNVDKNVFDGDDLVARERQAIEDFIADKSLPNERKHVILTRYSIDDVRLAQTLVAAKEAGIRVSLITDFNVSMSYRLKPGQTMLSDFSQATIKTDAAGRFIQTLIDAGFEIIGNGSTNKPQGAIYSQPLYNKGDASMDPIMHEKSLLLVAEPAAESQDARKVMNYYFSTANLTDHPRYNRLFEIQEALSMAYGLDHSDKIMAAFRAGKPIKDVESEPPYRVWFEDDSFMEAAYTNGKYNPNDRIIEILKGMKLKKAWLSHFVLTNGGVVEAFKNALMDSPTATIFGVFDDKFVPVTGYGKAAVMNGFMTAPPMGNSMWGWVSVLIRSTTLFSYLRGIEGKVETDMEGPPLARHLWHDKTTLLLVEEGGKQWYYLFTGSLNNSNHVDNAELQFMFRLPADSALAKAVIDSIELTVAKEKDYAKPLAFGLLRDAIATVAGLSPLHVSPEIIDAITKAVAAKNPTDAAAMFAELVKHGTELIGEKFLPKKATERFALFMTFLNWYDGERDAHKIASPMNARKLVALGAILATPNMKASTIMSLLSHEILWEPNVLPAELNRRLHEAWKVLGIERALPSSAPSSPAITQAA